MSSHSHPSALKATRRPRRMPLSVAMQILPSLVFATILETFPTPTTAIAAVTAQTQDLWTESLSRDRLRRLLTGPNSMLKQQSLPCLIKQPDASHSVAQGSLPVAIPQATADLRPKNPCRQIRLSPKRLSAKYVEAEGCVVFVQDILKRDSCYQHMLQREPEDWKLKLVKRRAAKQASRQHPELTRPLIFAIHNNLARTLAAEERQRHAEPPSSRPNKRKNRTRPTLAPLDIDVARAHKTSQLDHNASPDSPGPVTPEDEGHPEPSRMAKHNRLNHRDDSVKQNDMIRTPDSRGRTMTRTGHRS